MRTTVRAKARKVVVGGVAAAAVSFPLALASASSAEAATRLHGCTVTPLAPVRVIVPGTDLIRFPIRVTCVAHRIIQIHQQRWESDAPPGIVGDDFQGSRTFTHTFPAPATVVLSSYIRLPNTEPGDEELYHRVNFRVASLQGVFGPTTYERSVIRTFNP